ncbi:MAG: AAA family ATPase [Isosphaeraceae bacterium]
MFDRLRALNEATLAWLQGLIEARADRGVPRETHGDLRLSHVYRLPDRSPPGDLVIVDAIEFNPGLRYADPVSDAAFLAMDLAAKGRRDLARLFADAFLEASGDEEGRALLPFYTSYRAAVRAKVGGITVGSAEVSEAERAAALASARSHWLLALGALEDPGETPCLVLVGGLPGAGKSTLSAGLAGRAGFQVIRTDVVRKELAGSVAPSGFGQGLYTRDRTAATYDACRERALAAVFDGGRVIVDASFREEAHRRAFLDAAREWGVPCVLIFCRTDEETTRRRIAARAGQGDASDADFAVYQRARELWEPDSPETAPFTRTIDTTAGAPAALDAALVVLREFGLFPNRH